MSTADQSTSREQADQRERAARLLKILDLEPIEHNLYRAGNEVRGQFRLFGGQVLAQALRAAYRTVEGVDAHSLHAYFIRAGDASRPVLYEVDRIRDGRSFVTRRVVAIQQGEAIFSMSVSFQVQEQGFEHAHSMPNVPPPEELEDDIEVVRRLGDRHPGLSPMAGRARPFEMRSVFPLGSEAWQRNRFWNPVWIRFCADLPQSDHGLARCLLAYASDMGLVSTGALPHNETVPRSDLQMASLDHALWIHREVPMGDWLLFHKRTSLAEGARALCARVLRAGRKAGCVGFAGGAAAAASGSGHRIGIDGQGRDCREATAGCVPVVSRESRGVRRRGVSEPAAATAIRWIPRSIPGGSRSTSSTWRDRSCSRPT
ncbi:MAG: thioesterase family protein [Pseudomonadales bacterium]